MLVNLIYHTNIIQLQWPGRESLRKAAYGLKAIGTYISLPEGLSPLMSPDETSAASLSFLERMYKAVIPKPAGVNLQYYRPLNSNLLTMIRGLE